MEKKLSQCKNCGSELVYDPQKQILSCKYCFTHYHLPKAKVNAVLVRGYSNAFHPNQLNQSLNCYKCEMCEHTYFSSSAEKSEECPECGSPNISKIQSSGYCADGIIPFEISREKATENLVDYLKSKLGVPKNIVMQAKEKPLSGVFVPVWNFIFDIEASYTANAVDLRKDSNGMYYSIPIPVFGTKKESIKSADQCACSVEEDDFLELFNEYDYDKIIPYSTEYTYGYRVDNINRNIHEYYEIVKNDEEEKLKKEISHHILKKYKDVSNLKVETEPVDVYFNFAYVPVYVFTYTHKGRNYKTYVSGTTGKVVGKTPKTIKGALKAIAKTIGIFAAVALLCYFMFK